MRGKLLKLLPSLIAVGLFIAAFFVIRELLGQHHPHEIWTRMREIPGHRLLAAVGLTCLSFCLLLCYDLLALRYVTRRVPWPTIARASFIGYAFSNTVGQSVLSGGAVRYRFYSAQGLSVVEVGKIMLFSGFTFCLGFFALGGMALFLDPTALPSLRYLPPAFLRLAGAALLLGLAAYVALALLRKRPVQFRAWQLSPPSLRMAVSQILIGLLDWSAAGAVLYVLLPHTPSLSYATLVTNYVFAVGLGAASLVPGGIGVLDGALLLLLARFVPPSSALGSILAYRIIYYALPLCVAALWLGVHEVVQARKEVRRVAALFGRWATLVIPQVFAIATFMGGAILLFSGATPTMKGRFQFLNEFLPLPIIEGSHFLGSLAGAALLLLARGLQRRLDGAYFLALVLLAAGSALSLLKGLDYEEASFLALLFIALLPCHRYFHRKARLLNQWLTPGWMAAIMLVLLGSIWLGLFSYRHVQYSNELWYHFSSAAHAPRFMRASVGAGALVVLFSLAALLRPAPPEPRLPSESDLERAAVLVRALHDTSANLALLGDKSLLFSENREAFIMYGVFRNTWVALGNPVGAEKEWPDLLWQFRELCDYHGGRPVFHAVPGRSLHRYLDLGLDTMKIGEEARVPLGEFSLEGVPRKGLRYTHNKALKHGCEFAIVPQDEVPALLPELRGISDAWLALKNTSEKRFSLGFFDEKYLSRFPAAVVRQEGRIVAFANLWLGAEKQELSLDLMRYLPDAPQGVMEFLFVELMLWGRREGYASFSLGMAPLSGLENRALAPMWNRLGALIFRHGEHFYNFQGVRQYKEKFDPVWEPLYLVSPGGISLAATLPHLAALIAGGFRGVVAK